jgi:fatty acid desaturase
MCNATDHTPTQNSHRVAPRFLLFPIGAAAGQLMLMLWGPELSWSGQLLAIAAVSYFWFNVAGSFHEVAHHTLFRSVRANVWLGRAIGTFVLIPYTAYKETHRLHHAYLNTPDDTELWPYCDPTWSRRSRQIFAWIDIAFALITTPIIYGRVAWMSNSRLRPDVRRTIRREYAGILAVWTAVLGLIVWRLAAGTLHPAMFHPLWLSPLVISYGLNTLRKFTEHLGLASFDPVLGTRTVIGPSLVTRISSYFNFDIYIHGPHHRYPKAQHYELPQKLRELQAARPEGMPVFPTYRAAMLDMFPSLLQNPAVGHNVTSAEPPALHRAA